jgi:endonuclease/exonuclease/phosphatase family metal-dependent hydrolase
MLKIATWNLMKPVSQNRQSELKRYIDIQKADVWIFTEAHDSFTKPPMYAYSCSSAEGYEGQYKPEHRWVTICSHFQLKPLRTTDVQRTAAARVCPNESKPFVVFGTVLPWIGSSWKDIKSAGGLAFSASLEVQLTDWLRLREEYPEDQFFVAGDFNQDLVANQPRYYGSVANRRALESALESAGLRVMTAGNNDPVRKACKEKRFACIDHICCRQDTQWKSVKTMRWPDTDMPVKRISDHYGIAVELE